MTLLQCTLFAILIAACGVEADDEPECVDDACTAPPAAVCDGDGLIQYAALGECVNDECAYEALLVTCPGGCADGACIEPDEGSGE